MLGEISVASVHAYALFDPGATHSFVSALFVEKCDGLRPEPLESCIGVATPDGKILVVKSICRSCLISMEGWDLVAHLLVLSMTDFDVILGMD